MGGKNNKQTDYYRLGAAQVLKALASSRHGLDSRTAQARLEKYGYNRLEESDKESAGRKYLRQFKDLMILLLIASSIVSFALDDPKTGIVLIALVFFNTVIGFSQEYKAEKLMESLERLVVASANVLRNGKREQIDSAELVPGDIVYIEEGDSIPADLRLIEESELSTNDFALTGESNPSRKFTHAIGSDVELANRHNLVFMGTTVATGHAYGAVIATGMDTELGRIANLSAATPGDVSPLQRELNNIATRVTQGTVVLCAILLPLSMYYGLPFKNALLFAIGIASSIIPQGLPAEINTALAQAANKLARARALVKKLSAVESLGATSIICTDKTGTLTKNEMTVQELMIGYTLYSVTGNGYQANGEICDATGKKLPKTQLKGLELFFATGAFASNASVHAPDDQHANWYVLGDPTEGALITLAAKAGLEPEAMDKESPELKEFAFDSARKRMSSIRRYNGKLYVFVKGAPESVLERSDRLWQGGKSHIMSDAERKILNNQHMVWAERAMRNLGLAYKVLPAETDISRLKMEAVESGLTFIGLVSMVDPLREEVASAMKEAHTAQIKVSIITGDFAPTAKAVAAKAGLEHKHQPITVISGQELRQLDDAYILRLVNTGSIVFSRVSPEDKLRIVGLIKDSGKVVAVTGDGINDAPALKRADIGVAMGITGTDVAKQSAEIILLDDSFKTLVKAVQQGRTIFQNIKKATLSCFTSNAAELVVNLVGLGAFIAVGAPLPLSVMQILAIDMIAELFPIAALGWDKADRDLMREAPRDPRDHILNRRSVLDLAWCGLLIGGLAFLNFALFFGRHGLDISQADKTDPLLYLQATTLTYLTIVLCQLANIMQRRSARGLFTRYQFHNRALWIALAFSIFSVANIIYNPVIAPYFGSSALTALDWAYAAGAAAVFVAVREIHRHAQAHHSRKVVMDLHYARSGQ